MYAMHRTVHIQIKGIMIKNMLITYTGIRSIHSFIHTCYNHIFSGLKVLTKKK